MLKRILIAVAILAAAPYAFVPIYHFPPPRPFAGRGFLNPYAGLGGAWQRANLHAHGIAWGGLTNGSQPGEEVVRRYHELGYDVAGVSDYQRIASRAGVPSMPLYEHGYNISKLHQLAIGAHRVAWFDIPLWQSLSHKQFVIDQVAATADLVALTHPGSRYSLDDVGHLTGFHLMEVVNGPIPSFEVWDAALSSGRIVWGLGNDDNHDLNEPGRTAVAWTMINTPSTSTDHIVEALGAGRSYVAWRYGEGSGTTETRLTDVRFEHGVLSVRCEGVPSTIEFIGQNGAIRMAVSDALTATYTFDTDDTYIRTTIWSPNTVMFLNPILRRDPANTDTVRATVDVFGTWIYRGSLLLAGGVAVLLHFRRSERSALRRAFGPSYGSDVRNPARPMAGERTRADLVDRPSGERRADDESGPLGSL